MKKLTWILVLLWGASLRGSNPAPVDWVSVLDVLPDARAFREVSTIWDSYGDYVQRMEVRRGDIAFLVNKTWIYYQDGRMLSEQNLRNNHRYDSIFTEYNQSGPVERLPQGKRLPRSRDLLNAMFGNTESQVRRHCVTVTFLGHEIIVNRVSAFALRQIERDIYAAAGFDSEVERFIQDLQVVFSFHRKNVKGSRTLSFHAYGLALDLIPSSYQGLHANWVWSRSFKRRWYQIPLSERWSPPKTVLDTFKRHGFVWGGDWIRFDAVHFEFRPEIAFTRSADYTSDWLGGGTLLLGIK
jgi:hypothetical protein